MIKDWWKSFVKSDSSEDSRDENDRGEHGMDEDSRDENGADVSRMQLGRRKDLNDDLDLKHRNSLDSDDSVDDDDDSLDEESEQSESKEVDEDLAPRRNFRRRREYVDSSKIFFNEEIIERFSYLTEAEKAALRGIYRVELKGFGGGIWTIKVDENIEVVNRKEESETVLSMPQKDFIQIVNGDINPQLAMIAEKIKVTGDIKKAVMIQSLLYPLGF